MSVYTSDMYAFLIHIRFVRSAYYYVVKCWRTPHACGDACYTYTTVIYCNEFRTVSVRIHYTVLIATPEPL